MGWKDSIFDNCFTHREKGGEDTLGVLRALLRHYVIDAITRWEKRVYVTDVSFDESPVGSDQNLFRVRIAYRVIQAQVDGNLIFPFWREAAPVSAIPLRSAIGK